MDRLVFILFGYVLIGAPLVLFSWHEISEALLGRVDPLNLLAAIAVIPVLLGLLFWLGRYLRGLDGSNLDQTTPGGKYDRRGA